MSYIVNRKQYIIEIENLKQHVIQFEHGESTNCHK